MAADDKARLIMALEMSNHLLKCAVKSFIQNNHPYGTTFDDRIDRNEQLLDEIAREN